MLFEWYEREGRARMKRDGMNSSLKAQKRLIFMGPSTDAGGHLVDDFRLFSEVSRIFYLT